MIFLAPLHLLLLIFPAIFLLLSLKNRHNNIDNIFSQDVLQKISLYKNIQHKTLGYKMFLLSTALFIIAIAQPVLLSQKSTQKTDIVPLVIALDISNSMNKNDIYPSRISFALKKIHALIDMKKNLKISLLLFSKNAYIAYPMSEDLDSLRYILSNLHPKLSSGSNIFAAIEGSQYILQKYTTKNILLLSDGASSGDFTQELQYLKENKLTLNAMYISKKEKQKNKLKGLCNASGGVFSMYSFGQSDIDFLLKGIVKHSQHITSTPNNVQKKHQIQLFYYPLGLGVVLLLFLFLQKYEFRKTSQNILVFIMFFSSLFVMKTELNANLLDFKKLKEARKFYNNKDYISAIKSYKALTQTKDIIYNQANSFYKAKKYQHAIRLYNLALDKNSSFNATIYYNIANAYISLNKFKTAKRFYVKSLKIKDDKMAEENLETLILFMKNIKHKKSNKKDKYSLPKTMRSYSQETPQVTSSNYVVKLKNVVPREEDRWLKVIKENKPTIYLQKLDTKRMSKNANEDD